MPRSRHLSDLPQLVLFRLLREFVPLVDKARTLWGMPEFSAQLESDHAWTSPTARRLGEILAAFRPGVHAPRSDPRRSLIRATVEGETLRLMHDACGYSAASPPWGRELPVAPGPFVHKPTPEEALRFLEAFRREYRCVVPAGPAPMPMRRLHPVARKRLARNLRRGRPAHGDS